MFSTIDSCNDLLEAARNSNLMLPVMCRLVVILDQRVNVYALETLEKLCTLETAPNPKVGIPFCCFLKQCHAAGKDCRILTGQGCNRLCDGIAGRVCIDKLSRAKPGRPASISDSWHNMHIQPPCHRRQCPV